MSNDLFDDAAVPTETVVERLRRWDLRKSPRYMALTDSINGRGVELVGGLHPTMFKTIRNATRAARERHWWTSAHEGHIVRPHGVVVRFDPIYLPACGTESVWEGHGPAAPDFSEIQFAERQVMLWQERLVALVAAEKSQIASRSLPDT